MLYMFSKGIMIINSWFFLATYLFGVYILVDNNENISEGFWTVIIAVISGLVMFTGFLVHIVNTVLEDDNSRPD